MLRQRTLFAAVLFAVVQVMLASLSSSSTDLLQVLTGLPTFRLPCGFHSRACLVVSDFGFRNVWPIQFHLRLAISAGIHSCSVLAQSSLLLIFSGQYIFRIFLRHRLVKVCSLFDMDLVTLQVSEPCRRTDFILVVKICSLVFMDIDVEFHIGLRVLKACLALPTLLFTSSCAPPLQENNVLELTNQSACCIG